MVKGSISIDTTTLAQIDMMYFAYKALHEQTEKDRPMVTRLCSHTVPSPTINISLADGTPEPMTIAGTVISLQGSATLDPAVDSQVTVIRSWTLERSRDILIFNESTTPPYVTAPTFRPLAFSAGGVYIFTVTVSPSNPLNVIAPPGVNATYALNPLPYHDLLIEKVISSGECAGNETVSLTGSFDPLPNTADNYTHGHASIGNASQNSAKT